MNWKLSCRSFLWVNIRYILRNPSSIYGNGYIKIDRTGRKEQRKKEKTREEGEEKMTKWERFDEWASEDLREERQ